MGVLTTSGWINKFGEDVRTNLEKLLYTVTIWFETEKEGGINLDWCIIDIDLNR